MKVTRLYEDDAGTSHFGYVNVDLLARRPGVSVSSPLGASSVALMACEPSIQLDSHPAPSRQLMIVLRGHWLCSASDGERRTFGPGDMLLAEDTNGAGHGAATVEDGVVVATVVMG